MTAARIVLGVDAVLLDSDGVLADSHAQVDVAWTTLAREFGLDIDELWAELAGVPARRTLARHLDGDLLDAAVERLEDLEVETATGTPAIAGAARFVGSLAVGRHAFVTSASRRLASARWTAAGIEPPPHVVTADDVARGKPDPDPYLAAAALLGVDPSRCLVLEDADAGARAGRAAGATVVAVGDAPWSVPAIARVRDLADLDVRPGVDGFAMSVCVVDRTGAASA